MKNIVCKIVKCDKVDPVAVADLDRAYAELLVAAKNTVRVAVYKTIAIRNLAEAIERVEVARPCK